MNLFTCHHWWRKQAHTTQPISHARILPGAWRIICAALFALLLTAAASSLFSATIASAASSEPQLSAPPAELTPLKVGGLAATFLDSQSRFHLLYTDEAPHNLTNLDYKVVSSDGQSVQVVQKSITLADQVDTIDSASFVLDSRGRLHAAWIEVHKGITTIRQALVDDPTKPAGSRTITPQTLYQSDNALQEISGGADNAGNTFYSWLDSSGGTPNLAAIEVLNNQSAGKALQLTHEKDGLAFPHLVVYPDGTLTAVMLHQSPQGGWDLNLYSFDAAGNSLHAPTQIATQLHPGFRNTIGNDTNTFHFDPLAATLDARQHLLVTWSAVLQLGYADAIMQPDHSFSLQPKILGAFTYNYLQLCLSAGPATLPGQAATGSATPVWLAWLDDSHGFPMHPYIDQISDQGTLKNAPLGLVDQITVASNPCIQQDSHGGLFVTWQQYDDSGNYVLNMVTTTRPAVIPFWVRLGLNRDEPIQQIIFIILGSTLLGALGLLPNLLTAAVAAGVVRFGTRLHIHRLALLLIGLALFVAVELWFQQVMAANFAEPPPPIAWAIVGAIASVALIVYLWFRSRRYPPETMGAIGQIFLATYAEAIIVSIPLIYIFTQHQS